MRHFGHGIGHLEYGRVHETEPETRDEDREEDEQETEYQDEEEGDEPMWMETRKKSRQMKAAIAEMTATTAKTRMRADTPASNHTVYICIDPYEPRNTFTK